MFLSNMWIAARQVLMLYLLVAVGAAAETALLIWASLNPSAKPTPQATPTAPQVPVA